MPLTQDQQTIFDAVITALRTNSKTIDQLTPQASLADSDYFELNGGRKVSYATMKSMFAALSDADIVNLNQAITNAKLKGVSIALTTTGATLTVQSEGKSVSCAIPVAVYNSAADGEKKAGLMSAEDKHKLDTTVNDRVNDRGLISDLQRWGQEAGWMVQRVTHGKDDASDVYARLKMHKMDEPDSEPSYTEVVLVPGATESAAGAMTAQQVKDLKLAKGFMATKGRAEGIAPLDSSALVPEKHLPDKVFDVLTFIGIDDSLYDLEAGSAAATPEDANASLVYSSVRDHFVLRVRETVSGGGISTNPPKYYGWFNGAERYGTPDQDGIVPYENKLYLDLYDGGVYYWYDLMLRKTDLDVSIRVDSLENKIGKANGIAPLNASGVVPNENISDEARKSLFCDLFNAAAGSAGYAKFTNGLWDCKLNGLTLSYDEAVLIYNVTNGSPATEGFAHTNIRTNFWRLNRSYGSGVLTDSCPAMIFYDCRLLEVINVRDFLWVNDMRNMFAKCPKLTEVSGVIGDTDTTKVELVPFPNSPLITSFKLHRLQHNYSFAANPLIDLDSFDYMVTNRVSTNTNNYTVTVHADVYAKLTGDTTNEAAAALTADELSQWQALLTKAAGKHIAFASA